MKPLDAEKFLLAIFGEGLEYIATKFAVRLVLCLTISLILSSCHLFPSRIVISDRFPGG